MKFDDYKSEVFEKRPEVKVEYEKMQPEIEFIRELVNAREKQNISQKDLAKLIGTGQARISKIENGVANPSLKVMTKIAEALNMELHISMKPKVQA